MNFAFKLLTLIFGICAPLFVFSQLHTPITGTGTSTVGSINWSTTPSTSSEFNWSPNGSLSNTFTDISGLGVDATVTFTGETATFGTWGGVLSPGVGTTPTGGGAAGLQLYTSGYGTTGISMNLDFNVPVLEIGFDLSNVNALVGFNGDIFTVTGTNSIGQTVLPTFVSSPTPSYVTNAVAGTIDANASSTAGNDDEVGINLADPLGIVSFNIVWQNCTSCSNFYIHGLGIMDIDFSVNDADGDLVMDFIDIDADNDGIPDLLETISDPFADADNDGVFAYLDDDDTDPLVFNANNDVEAIFDFDGDNVANHLDLDSDNDGTSDIAEAGGIDTNGDGQIDYVTVGDPTTMIDSDKDGLGDIYDPIVSTAVVLNQTGDCSGTTVGYNHIINYSTSLDATSNVSIDFCLSGDYGTASTEQIVVTGEGGIILGTYSKTGSTIPTYADCGATPFCQSFTISMALWNLWNNDGTVTLTFTPTAAVNFCAIYSCLGTVDASYSISSIGSSIPLTNTDGVGASDFLDLDSDNDGITDLIEFNQGSTTDDFGGGSVLDGMIGNNVIIDVNNNGWDDSYEGVDARPDSDGDGVHDLADIDSDNDGIRDFIEGACTTCPSFNNSSSTDSDSDGISDQYENLTSSNAGGGLNQGLNPNDDNSDIDGIPDYLDTDTDGDGGFDWSEGYDTDGDGNATPELPNYALAYVAAGGSAAHYPMGDPEIDGVPEFMDNQPGVLGYIEANRPPFLDATTSYWHDADNDGLVDLLDEDIAGLNYGTYAPIPNSDGIGDLDWRDINSIIVLPIELLFFDATIVNRIVELSWQTSIEINNDYFLVERSIGDGDWEEVVVKNGAGNSTSLLSYSDYDLNPYYGISYYRLKQVDFNGAYSYSDVKSIQINGAGSNNELVVYPNVFENHLFVNQKDLTEIHVFDVIGKDITPYVDQISISDNVVRLDFTSLSSGTYLIHTPKGSVKAIKK